MRAIRSNFIQLALLFITLSSFISPTIAGAKRWGGNNFDGKKLHYEIDDMSASEEPSQRGSSLFGSGREFNIFDARGGDSNAYIGSNGSTARPFYSSTTSTRTSRRKRSSVSNPSPASTSKGKSVFSSLKEWIQSGNLPKIQCRVEPNTTLKVRKTFRPLKTVVKLGADFNTQLGVWQFKSSWEDDVIGGKITLAGRELQFSKTWLLSVGAVEDLVTRLRMRAAVDLGTMKAYARLGFRTERLSPINVVEGFTLMKRLPLDGNDGHVKLEVKANFAFPEPEIEYSTENHRSFVGTGDIEVNIDELNLLLDY